MEIVVLVLMFLVMFMTWLKLSFLKAWHIAVISAVCSLFIVLTWRIAIEQSREAVCSMARKARKNLSRAEPSHNICRAYP